MHGVAKGLHILDFVTSGHCARRLLHAVVARVTNMVLDLQVLMLMHPCFGQPMTAATFTNLGGTGTYQDIASMSSR